MNWRELKIIVSRLTTESEHISSIMKTSRTKLVDKLDSRDARFETSLTHIETKLAEVLAKLRDQQQKERQQLMAIFNEEEERMGSVQRRLATMERQLDEKLRYVEGRVDTELAKLEKKLNAADVQSSASQLEIETTPKLDPKAATLAIYDSIIFAISNWSNEGDSAPDFELACQATLFPTIYERVMKGEDDYYIEEVPSSAMEVVKRGREYVKMLRETCNASLLEPKVWEDFEPMVHEWWINDALPLLYGARADDWDKDVPLSLIEIQSWKQQPASRALHFPLIFDGMELVEKNRDQIRESSGLPEFNKQTLQTRLQP